MTTDGGKTAPGIGQPVIFDIRQLAGLREGVRIVEICSGREFVVGAHHSILWHGNTRCTVHVLELPVQIISGPDPDRKPRR